MPASAHDIAAELRRRMPGLGVKKLHKLLYYCQGHHLATFDRPLFAETISAWDMGPVVGELWKQEKTGDTPTIQAELGEAELNTIGYVISRYGNLTGNDLEHLTHGEPPWQLADANRAPRTSAPIRREWIRDYFATAGAPGDEDEPVLDAIQLKQWLADALGRPLPTTPDDIDRLKARLASRV